MNHLEQELHYPLADQVPNPGQCIAVAPGIFWIRMGLPFALNHINLWLLEDEIKTEQGVQAGWTVVDCGINSDTTRDAWEVLFGSHLRGLPILRVLVTHCHPDHVGLADWLCSRWKAPLLMSTGEYAFARMMSAGLPGVDGSAMFPHFRKHGLVTAEMQEKIQERKTYYTRLVPTVPTSYQRLQDQQEIHIGKHTWRVITGFGHSPEHVSLYCAEMACLISGDMLLPRISTNVSVFAVEPEANPVSLYLNSLTKYADLPEQCLVLPSHGKPFQGMHKRIAQLHQHHADRLDEVLRACTVPLSANEIVPIMFKRELDAHQLTFALGEALAHCHYLWFEGKLKRELGADDVYRFVAC
ncbi:MBL fold metallo-hydrolase [Undibacterium cyanobacteriorum]|uniref:MBL fold metallo-hydrolase n=1 Tax=Undibacterium cyanobacteriorum TaxID=3073561 RepID=A0ABY9RJG2_9BURK|nr:MBL fold metallo-hydrolase [Undibacterium sp. 20NA77.5]WMW80410.1 MBL fold metallo-hydrolase [Undibacterium sp. 20NA77.5]